MRHSLLFSVLVGSLLFVGLPVVQAQPEGDTVTDPDATVYVDGLACPFCAYGLEKKLDALDPIYSLEVQVEESRILVTFREEARVSEEELRQAVEDAGFSARKIEFSEEEPSRQAT